MLLPQDISVTPPEASRWRCGLNMRVMDVQAKVAAQVEQEFGSPRAGDRGHPDGQSAACRQGHSRRMQTSE